MKNFSEKIQEILESFMSSGSIFSAHDVTVELRSNNERVWHNAIKDSIHSEAVVMMNKHNYEKSYGIAPDGSSYIVYQPKSTTNPVMVSVPMATITATPVVSASDFNGRELDFLETSSWITRAVYDGDSDELLVETVSHKNYIYEGVDSRTVLEWEMSDSPGSYFNENIKNEFAWKHAN